MSIVTWFKSWRQRREDDEDLQEEIRAHLAMAAADRIADGADPTTARQASLKEFGNVTLTREAAHRVWTPSWLDTLRDYVSDVRYAGRALAKHRTFSLTVIAVLTIGIGLNAVVFTMLKSMALSPIAGVERSASLGVLYGQTNAGRDLALSYPDYQYFRDHDTAFSGLLGSRVITATMGRGKGARPVYGEVVSSNYFDVLGVRAAAGRTLQPSDEEAPGRAPVVVISDALWRQTFNADPAIIGTTLEINNQMLTVVGVTDPTFHGTVVSYDVEVFIPVMMAPQLGFRFSSTETTPSAILADRRANVFYAMGRLRPGTTMAGAREQAGAVWTTLAANRPVSDVVQRVNIVPFWQSPGTAPAVMLPVLIALSATGLLVLLIACANIAGLVVARGISRRGEIAVRLALGATRMRIVRLLVIENLVLALPGAVLGVLLAARAIPVFVGYAVALAAPSRLFLNIETDALVISFAVVVACGSALVFGFVPALRSSRIDLVSVIKEDSPQGASRGVMRTGLVIAQVAVSLLLLVGAGLVTRSLVAAEQADRGFDGTHVTAVDVDVKANAYTEPQGRVFYRKLLDAARDQPGVESAALAATTPLTFLDRGMQRVAIEGLATQQGDDLSMLSNVVSPDYFSTLRIPVMAGREFDDRDDEVSTPVVVINRTMAERFWGTAAAAIGKRISVGDSAWRTVAGVVADVKYSRVDEDPRPYVYLPFEQSYRAGMVLHTRGAVPMGQLVEQARGAVASLDADLPILEARSLQDATRGALIFFRLMASMLFVFGVAGIALAAMGTYGLVSYAVTQSTREIGIRMALGASGSSVIRVFLARGLRLGVIGAVVGLLAAVGASRLLGSLLYGVSATDLGSFVRAAAIVLGGVGLATIIPAWRASRTDPLRALRRQ